MAAEENSSLEQKERQQQAAQAGAAFSEEPVRIAVFVSGGGTNLQALLDAQRRGELPHGRIRLVVSNRADAYALIRAEKAGVKTAVVSRDEARLLHLLEAEKIELIVLAGYLAILSEHFTKCYADRILNIHPSLIPSFCGKGFYGLKVHEAALQYGVKVTGATVHYVNEVPDGGKILLQKAVNVEEGDTPEVLQQRVMREAEWILLPKAAELVSRKLLSERQTKAQEG